ncbi:hypothetical protein [Bacillus cereus]|uniref:hypothetical protein n=1 Tax=Bacillus cereus TaxID=1396 RepID=UPI001C8BFA08|nr:hypothetical protein [Bacillus cereus]MBX9158503.1 hypothetical protein [Bacillus cereus]
MLTTNYVKMNQNGLESYMFQVNVEDLVADYILDIYDEEKNPEGYHYVPVESMCMGLANQLIRSKGNMVVPIQFVGAVDKEDVSVNNMFVKFEEKVRIVVGQDRVRAFELAVKKLKEQGDEKLLFTFLNYKVPITVMVIDKEKGQRRHELETYILANKSTYIAGVDKALKVKERLYPDKVDYLNDTEKLIKNLADDIANSVNNGAEIGGTVWEQGMIEGETVSLDEFSDSIQPVIREVLNRIPSVQTKEDVDILVDRLGRWFVFSWWDIQRRWKGTFGEMGSQLYVIQKPIGVRALHTILSECVADRTHDWFCKVDEREASSRLESKLNQVTEEAGKRFSKVLRESRASDNDWWYTSLFEKLTDDDYLKAVNYVKHGKFPWE